MLYRFAYFGTSPTDAHFILPILLVGLVLLVFEIAMIVSAIRNQAITYNAKLLWILGMLLLHPFVAIAYYFTDYKKV
ncbi:MAG: hypothetical protein JWN38_905 [Candidatus Saccharibacteria bacterium]|nr:hypothetical protein [Candidatus Saccharibacteria bacterium]